MYRHTKIALVDFSHLDRQYSCQEPKTPNKIHNSRHKRNSFGVARAIKGLLKHAVTVSLKKKKAMNLKENREWYMGEFEKKKDICYNYNLKNKRESEKGKSFSLEK